MRGWKCFAKGNFTQKCSLGHTFWISKYIGHTKNVSRTGSGKVTENLPRATRVQRAINQSVCTMCHRDTVNHLAESMIQLSRG